MDRAGPRARRLNLLIVAGASAVLVAAIGNHVLRAETWLAPGMRVAALSERPHECLAPGGDARMIAIGRAAFRAPLLLGGQAARSGISCATCHRSGRSSPAFFLADLSDRPGTADVTNSLMSSHRGNGVFDPKPIPDLTLPGKIARDPANPALANFVRGLITEEFDGAKPPPIVLDGLLAYLRALQRCSPDTLETITVDAAIADTEAAMAAARDTMTLGDRAGTRLLIGAARSTLGDVDERYAGLTADRAGLAAADRGLLALQRALDRGADITGQLTTWRFPPALAARLRRDAPRSLYDRATLARAVGD